MTSSIASNYGGIMQNFALQQVLKGMGHNPLTIDIYKPYSRLRWIAGRVKGVITGNNVNIPYPWYGRIGSRKVLQFAFNYIDRTRPMINVDSSIIEDYNLDGIIVGSDQVWRLKYNNNIETMFLDFALDKEIKRIAYAASFGVEEWDYPDSLTRRCQNLIKQFDAVSVRELSDVALCNEYLLKEATHVLDPTLLIDKQVYLDRCSTIPQSQEPFLFAYLLDITEKKQQFIYECADILGLRVKFESAENNLRHNDTLEGWIASFRDASYVITDSYHGTLFSIIFNKDFITINNPSRGQSRFISLLSLLNLRNRLIDIQQKTDSNSIIDWTNVNQQILKQRQLSLVFLKESLTP